MKRRPEYEPSDIAPRHIGYSAVLLFGGLAVSAALVAGLLTLLDQSPQNPPVTALESATLTPPQPRLEIDGRADRATVEAEAALKLKGYAWVDRPAGTARIPIARAMQLLATRGWRDARPGSGAP